MKDLFVPLPARDDGESVVGFAIGLAHAYRARLSLWLPPPALGVAPSWGSASASALSGLVERAELLAADRARALRERLRGSGVDGEVTVEPVRLEAPLASMARRARHADLAMVVRHRGAAGFDATLEVFSALLSASGRPVLVVPATVPLPTHPFRRVLLAWKPTREASRACHDALAVLQPRAMDVLVVDPARVDGEPGADIAGHLARHGLQVDVATRTSTGLVARAVLQHAAETGAEAIVAGGYGHARLREWALGGTTRELLADLDRPVLFSH